jgi:hypothetical protein
MRRTFLPLHSIQNTNVSPSVGFFYLKVARSLGRMDLRQRDTSSEAIMREVVEGDEVHRNLGAYMTDRNRMSTAWVGAYSSRIH